jgi:hypothetical protein
MLCVCVCVQQRLLFQDKASLYRREVRIFFAAAFPGTKPERTALMKYAQHKLRQHCDALNVSVTIVDLMFQVVLPVV